MSGIEVALEWNLLNSYTGLIMPLVATATGTFLYRQFFLTIPDELVEAAKMDGAGPLRFLWDILIPLSRTNMAALATIMFVVGWNQYLWPLLIITDPNYGVAAVELSRLVPNMNTTGGRHPQLALGHGRHTDRHAAARGRRHFHAALVRARTDQHRQVGDNCG